MRRAVGPSTDLIGLIHLCAGFPVPFLPFRIHLIMLVDQRWGACLRLRQQPTQQPLGKALPSLWGQVDPLFGFDPGHPAVPSVMWVWDL